MYQIYVWADGTWCDPEDTDASDYAHMSDDYDVINVGYNEDPEQAVTAYLNCED